MDKETHQSSEDILNDELMKAEKQAKTNASLGRKIAQDNQFVADLSYYTRDINNNVPGVIDYESQIEFWKNINTNLENEYLDLGQVQRSSFIIVATSGTAAMSVSVQIVNPGQVISRLPQQKQPSALKAIENYNSFISRPELKIEVHELLEEWGFDKSPSGRKNAVEQYLLAYQAFEGPVSDANPVSTSLIPMRECINTVIEGLLHRRPKQEETKSKASKIISIGKQLGKDGLIVDVIDELAKQYENLLKILSGSKQSVSNRQEWARKLNQANLFLISLLTGLDQSKSRTKKARHRRGK